MDVIAFILWVHSMYEIIILYTQQWITKLLRYKLKHKSTHPSNSASSISKHPFHLYDLHPCKPRDTWKCIEQHSVAINLQQFTMVEAILKFEG